MTAVMSHFDHPFVIFAVSFVAQLLAALAGDYLRKRARIFERDEQEGLIVVETASLTLLALIIGFSFSMAVSRYDLRKNYEEAEANAIGTEYARADLLAEDGAALRRLLGKYADLRVSYYLARDPSRIGEIDAELDRLQDELWSIVSRRATAQPTPVAALVVSGMNDVLNSRGYTQAAWWNRIPAAAWWLMGFIAIFCNFLVGYSERRTGRRILVVLPMIGSIAFFLIADMDNPRSGVIRVTPQNLIATLQSLKEP
jgi:hypothetical protein